MSKTSIPKDKSFKVQSKFQEPLLYANEYHFQDEENFKKFQEIQKRSKVIRRKLIEMKVHNQIHQKIKHKNRIQEVKDFFYKQFKLNQKWLDRQQLNKISKKYQLETRELSDLQEEVRLNTEIQMDRLFIQEGLQKILQSEQSFAERETNQLTNGATMIRGAEETERDAHYNTEDCFDYGTFKETKDFNNTQ